MIPMITVLHVRVGVYKLFSPFSGLNPELVMTYNVHSVALSSVLKVMLYSAVPILKFDLSKAEAWCLKPSRATTVWQG